MTILFHIYSWCKKNAAKGEDLMTGYRYSPKEYQAYISQFDFWLDNYFRGLFLKTKDTADFLTLVQQFYDRRLRFGEGDGKNDLELGFVNEQNAYDNEKIASFFREPGAYFKISGDLHKNIGAPVDCYVYLFYEEAGEWLERSAHRFFDSELCQFSEDEKERVRQALKLAKEKLAIDDKMVRTRDIR